MNENKFYPHQINQAIAYARSLQQSETSAFRLIYWEEHEGKDRIYDVREWQGLNYKIFNFSFRSIPYHKNLKYFTVALVLNSTLNG
jgi:hypothetical protein